MNNNNDFSSDYQQKCCFTRKNKKIYQKYDSNYVPLKEEPVTFEGQTILFWSCQQGYYNVVKTLLEQGYDKNRVDIHGKTPLDYVIEGGHTKLLELFE